MPGRARVEGECAMSRTAPGSQRPIVWIIDGVPVTVIGWAALGLELAAGDGFTNLGLVNAAPQGTSSAEESRSAGRCLEAPRLI
jgi:hypothetical protein